ncbi:MAG: bifunctional [glutamine synthetase] adenylyltransferase/[glutamine synthetase]-adenylyl-L-tyrosine phosphorylase, partial [Hyphomicrobiales bacterium]
SYLTSLILREPALLADILLSDPDSSADSLSGCLDAAMKLAATQEEAMKALRRYKNGIALLTALADIAGVWSVAEVTAALARAARASLRHAVGFLLARAAQAGSFRPADPADPAKGSGYIVIGMGKLGADELNYSSDIDLIIFFDRARAPLAGNVEPSQFFVRVTRDLVKLMQERTADGYVFRTDLRLRPDPGATQIALSTDAGLSYYESFGQNWERAALIKARAVAGDIEAGDAFLEQLSPFVWRKYLDYAAIADIHAMKRRVHRFKGHGEIAVAGHNIKLGRGGIREIEFIAQTHQLIAGGRQDELRLRGTVETLTRLNGLGWISAETAGELTEAYGFLRMVEHRLQMIADEQTHSLPGAGPDLDRVACFCGFGSTADFAAALIERLSTVQKHYEGLFERIPQPSGAGRDIGFRGDEESPDNEAALKKLGFSDPAAVTAAVTTWRSGRYAATRSERARERLTEFLPHLLEALGATADPDAALLAFDRFLSELPAGVQLFSLLRANPSLLRLIADIMGTAPRLARVLSRRARVLDAVLDPGFFGSLPDDEALSGLVEAELSSIDHYQDFLDRARVVGTEQAFLIGVRILSATISAEQAGGAYARLAGHLLRALYPRVMTEMARAHGTMPGGEAVVVAMGKLGGFEMTASSDLDLIIVYDFDAEAAMSLGTKPLAGSQYFSRFTQRFISAVTAPTAEGSLYEVDMRLRPSGNAGPVATRFDGFLDYHRNTAWTWEHLALTRARVVTGSPGLTGKVNDAIRGVLCRKRDRAKIAADVREMRERIAREKPAASIWDLKQARGGLVDLEFIAQFLQIVSAHEHPDVLDQNTAASIEKLARAGVLSPRDAATLHPCATLLHNLTQVLRLCLDRPFEPEQAPQGLKSLLLRAADAPDFPALEVRLEKAMDAVHKAFDRLIV